MPANARAMRATNIYREHIATLRAGAEGITRRAWGMIGPDLDATHAAFVARLAPSLVQLQHTGASLSGGYLAAYLAVSHGQAPTVAAPTVDALAIGQSRAGKPLAEALVVPLITVKRAISAGRTFDEVAKLGGLQAVRNAGEDVAHTARSALFAGIAANDELVGWRRVTSGGCGACLALADGTILPDDADLEVHDGCQCTGEPVVRGVRETVQRDTGQAMFIGMTVEQQDQLLGPDKARLVRDGDVPFDALVDRSPMKAIADQITEAPLQALHT